MRPSLAQQGCPHRHCIVCIRLALPSLCPVCATAGPHQAAILNLQSMCRKRLKKAVAADGESPEEPGNELEDSDVNSDEDKGFVATDEDNVSGERNSTSTGFVSECHEIAMPFQSSHSSMACWGEFSLGLYHNCVPESMSSLPMLPQIGEVCMIDFKCMQYLSRSTLQAVRCLRTLMWTMRWASGMMLKTSSTPRA